MRHLFGVALAVLLAAAVFFVAAWGYVLIFNGISASAAANNGRPPADGGDLPAAGGSLFQNGHVMVGGAALLAVGLVAGLLMVLPRVSPLAAGLPGVVLVAWTVLYVCDVGEATRLIPLKSRDFGTGFEVLLSGGLLGAAGLAMIAPLLIPSRWRRSTPAAGYAAPGESRPGLSAPAAREMGGSGLDPTITGLTTPSSGVLPGWEQTRPQQGRVIPPGGSRPPWDPPDQG